MRIAFDATAILGPMSKNRGIGNYSYSQFSTMIQMDKGNEYFFFNMFESGYSLKAKIAKENNLSELSLDAGPGGILLKNGEFSGIVGEIIKKYIHKNKIDVFIITSPFDSYNVMYQKEWFDECKVVAVVYDIIPYVIKEHYLSDKTTYKWYMKCIDMLRWVDEIQVISQSVKDDLISYLNFDADKISVIWGAVDERYQQIEIEENERVAILDKFDICNEFIMCTGGDDERKNLAGLIEAYSKLPRKLIEEYQLVIVCKLSEQAVERYTTLAEKLEIEGKVVLTNFVSDRELLVLYNMAKLMAFPSVYEGFGLPVVEAWACGTPVLTSNNSSLVQIAGDAAVIVNPYSVDDVSRGLEYALTKCNLEELIQKGKNRLEMFRWERVATAAIASIKKLEISKRNEEVKRKRIAFFTPLPPQQSGIADYSVDIIKALHYYCNVDVFIDKGYEPDVDFQEGINIYPSKKFHEIASRYTEIFYQMGNSTFHLYMYEFIKKYPGIVVLHDYNMHGVLLHNSLGGGKNNFNLYESYLLEDYSKEQVKDYINKLKNGQCGYRMREWELNGVVTNYAKKIIVHSFDAKEKLLKKDIATDVKQIWSFVKLEDKLSKEQCAEIKQSKGYEQNNILIAAFGHIHETKRAIPILRAIGRIVQENKNVRMVFVGKMADELKTEFAETINELGIQDYVRVTGYTSLQEFEEYVNATDICLNFRFPYNGETSASLVRNLAKGNIVITNNIGSFAEIPDDVCIKIPDVSTMTKDEEIAQIYAAIEKCINDPVGCEQIQSKAIEFAQNNLDVKKAAKEYFEFMESGKSILLSEKFLEKMARFFASTSVETTEIYRVAETLTWLKEG